MYDLFTAGHRTEKRLQLYLAQRRDIQPKLESVRRDPRHACDAHPLHGRLQGKWSCWLGGNIRMVYSIDDINKKIIVEAVGSHKVY